MAELFSGIQDHAEAKTGDHENDSSEGNENHHRIKSSNFLGCIVEKCLSKLHPTSAHSVLSTLPPHSNELHCRLRSAGLFPCDPRSLVSPSGDCWTYWYTPVPRLWNWRGGLGPSVGVGVFVDEGFLAGPTIRGRDSTNQRWRSIGAPLVRAILLLLLRSASVAPFRIRACGARLDGRTRKRG